MRAWKQRWLEAQEQGRIVPVGRSRDGVPHYEWLIRRVGELEHAIQDAVKQLEKATGL